MEFRKGVSLVVYRKEKDKILYLVLKRKLRWTGYEFAKGGKLKGESYVNTIKRELKEETGLKPIKIIKLKEKLKFNYPKKDQAVFHKKGFIANCYLVEVGSKKVKLRKEHSSYKWLSYKDTKNTLTFKDTKRILIKSNKIIKDNI
jgi:8-oxo-dGTP pyrophosphatase MutT (NUDIX family)